MFIVNEFRYLSSNDEHDPRFSNWSRTYEYPAMLNQIKKANLTSPSIHNTCSGSANLHMEFAKELQKFSSKVVHSDLRDYSKEVSEIGGNFYQYDIETKNDKSYDIVICVSSLEDIVKTRRELVLNNLIDQTNNGGRVLLTCDYHDPQVCNMHNREDCETHGCSPAMLQQILGQPIQEVHSRLNGGNAKVAWNHDIAHYNIILIDLTIVK